MSEPIYAGLIIALLASLHLYRLMRVTSDNILSLVAVVRNTSGLAREAEAQATSLAIQVTELYARAEETTPAPPPPPMRLLDWEERTMAAILALEDKAMRERKAYHEQLRLSAIIVRLDRFVRVPFAELTADAKEGLRRLPTVEEQELAQRARA